MNTGLMACSTDWLDWSAVTYTNGTTGTVVTVGGTVDLNTNALYQTWYPYYYPVYTSSPARPIRLTLGEVERLRKAAKTDDKLKAILQKFTAQIEIAVEFD